MSTDFSVTLGNTNQPPLNENNQSVNGNNGRKDQIDQLAKTSISCAALANTLPRRSLLRAKINDSVSLNNGSDKSDASSQPKSASKCKITRGAGSTVTNSQYEALRKGSNIGTGKKVRFAPEDLVASVDLTRKIPVNLTTKTAKPAAPMLTDKDKMLRGSNKFNPNDIPSNVDMSDKIKSDDRLELSDRPINMKNFQQQKTLQNSESGIVMENLPRAPRNSWQRLLDAIWNCFCCCFGRRGDE